MGVATVGKPARPLYPICGYQTYNRQGSLTERADRDSAGPLPACLPGGQSRGRPAGLPERGRQRTRVLRGRRRVVERQRGYLLGRGRVQCTFGFAPT